MLLLEVIERRTSMEPIELADALLQAVRHGVACGCAAASS
jgi:hypothetical protein